MKKVAIIIGFAAAASAYAGTPVKSEFFYQTEQEKHQVTPEFGYNTLESKTNTGKQETTGQELNVKYEYGINEMFSAGAQLGYLTSTEESGGTDTDTKGLKDFTFFMRGQQSFVESSSFHYGAWLNVSPGKATQEGNENSAMSGGIGFKPYVGYQWLVGKGVVGANLSTELDLGDRTIDDKDNSTEIKETGANATELTGFYEHGIEKGLVGFALTYGGVNTTEQDTNGTESKVSGYNYLAFKVYPTYQLTETATLVGQLAYTNVLSDQIVSNGTPVELDSSTGWNLNIGGRFTF